MANISISVDAANVSALLSRAPERISLAMRGSMEDATTFVLARVRRYPPQRPGSGYIRTGTLNRSWSKRVEGSGLNIRGTVGSNGAMAPYNRLVQSRRDQAIIHQGRWQTIEDVAEQEQNTVVRMFQDRLAAAGLDRP